MKAHGAADKVPDLLAGIETVQAALAEALTVGRDDQAALQHLERLDAQLRHLQVREDQRLADALASSFDGGELTMLGAECQDLLSRRRLQLPSP